MVLIKKVLLVFLIIFTACDKTESTDITLEKLRKIEGYYKGTYTLKCDSLGIRATHPNEIWITALSTEELMIKTMNTTGNAYIGYSDVYHYARFQWIDVTDCGLNVAIEFFGTGVLCENKLNESGHMTVHHKGKKYGGTWSTTSVKIN